MLITLEKTLPKIPFYSSIVILRAGAAIVIAVTEAIAAATRAFDSFTIDSRLSFASTSTAAISALSLQQVSSKMTLVCSAIIVNSICNIVIDSEVEEVVPVFRSLFRDIVAS